jgi:hypothetical protein
MKTLKQARSSMEDYRSIWWVTTIVSWIVTVIFAFSVVRMGFLPFGGNLSAMLWGVEFCHYLGLLSPFFAWRWARGALRRASPPTGQTTWFLTGTPPAWTIGIIFTSACMTMLAVAIGGGLYYGIYVLIPLFLLSRLGVELFWFARCFRDASRVAVLERAEDASAAGAFLLRAVDGTSKPISVRECDDYSSTVYLVEGETETLWKAVGPIDDLAAELRATAAIKAGKKHGS